LRKARRQLRERGERIDVLVDNAGIATPRARRTAQTEPPVDAPVSDAPVRAPDAPTEKLRVFGVDPAARRQPDPSGDVARVPAALVERLWLRGTTSLLTAMGLALTAVAVATYLLAVSSDTAAWAALRGISSHSYAYALTETHAQVVAGTGKECWVTEAGENGHDSMTNDALAYATVARLLQGRYHAAPCPAARATGRAAAPCPAASRALPKGLSSGLCKLCQSLLSGHRFQP
jgi:hypothetical protein